METRVLILGTTVLAGELVDALHRRARVAYERIGIVHEPGARDTSCFPCAVLGSLSELKQIVAAYRPARIIVALAERRGRMPVRKLIEARVFQGVVVEQGDDVYERLTGKLAIDALTPSSVLFSPDFQPSAAALVFARAVSVAVAVIGLVGLAPLLLLIALAIVCESGAPILFVQDRIGRNGVSFKMMKFRTMRPAAGAPSEWARDNHDRITRVGRWLRKYRLDELPQLVNVLRGDMNLVGPRPHPASNYGLFTLVSRNIPECGEQIPYYSLRIMVRPGITGWAQICYRYANDLNEEMEKLRYDLYYIKRYSIWLDLRILLDTVKVVLLGREQRAPAAAGAAGAAHSGAPVTAPRVAGEILAARDTAAYAARRP